MRDAVNIHDVSQLGIEWLGLNFCPSDKRYVSQISSRAGIIPDYGSLKVDTSESNRPKLCGIFKDDMPQNIVTCVYNFNLDIVQLDGEESPVMLDNLRRTIDPDIHAGIKIMKTISVRTREDINQYKPYVNSADYFLFDMQTSEDCSKDWTILNEYDGNRRQTYLYAGYYYPILDGLAESIYQALTIFLILSSMALTLIRSLRKNQP